MPRRRTESTARRMLAVASCACVMLTGCESTRSFFQMTSDSPSPFFGFDMTLPPKFGRGQDAVIFDGSFKDAAANAQQSVEVR